MVTRAEIEESLLKWRFAAYNEKVRGIVHGIAGPIDRKAIKAIWDTYRPEVRHLKKFDPNLFEDISFIKAYKAGELNEPIAAMLSRYFEAARVYDDKLERASDEELLIDYRRLHAERLRSIEHQARERDALAWFNLPECDLDLSHWAGMQGISAEEAAAIALGKDPRRLQADKLKPFDKVSRSLFTERYGKLLRSATAHAAKKGASGLLSWSQVLEWAKAQENVTAAGAEEGESETPAGDGIDTRISHTFYKILFGMCAAHYGWDNRKGPSQVSEWLASAKKDMNEIGVNIDRKTVLSRLNEAYEYMSSRKDWPPKPRLKP